MEEQLGQLLANTQLPQEGPRKQAELELLHARTAVDFPLALARIGAHASAPLEIRQAALTYLRKFVESHWNQHNPGDEPSILVPSATKAQLKPLLLELALSPEDERKVKVAASYVVSKIAMNDFPDDWPELLPTVLNLLPNGSDAQRHGALRILQDLVEESITEHQFFTMARDIIDACHGVATNETRRHQHRALAVLLLRSSFDLMEQVKETYEKEVKAFADEVLGAWLPYFEQVLEAPLPDRGADAGTQPESWCGPVALKTQVLKTLIKIRSIFPSLLLPRAAALFSAVWDELNTLQSAYQELYIESDAQSRLEDIDGLPFTLDFLVLDEIDFLNLCSRAPPVQKELRAQLAAHATHETPWLLDLMKLLVNYAQITQEEEGLWDIDVSLYLAEEASVSSNYTARTACGDLLIKLAEWLKEKTLEGLFACTKPLFTADAGHWRNQEASLFLFNMLVGDYLDTEQNVPEHVSRAYMELVNYAVNLEDQSMLRARGFLVAGALSQFYQPANALLDQAIGSMTRDPSELVQVACIKAVEGFIKSDAPLDRQVPVILAIQQFLEAKDLAEIENADDLMSTLLETLRTAIMMDVRIAVQPDSKAIDLVFLIAKHSTANFQVEFMLTELFEDIVQTLSDSASYTAFCTKVLPLLTAALDIANVTQDDPLVVMACEILVAVTQHGSEPLPVGFVASTLPRLHRFLMHSTDGEILRPAAETIKYMLMHDHQQMFGWHDENGRSGPEVCLHIIDRLLGPNVEDSAGSEVGGLAAELVEKAGTERLGPFLPKLLQVVAERLATAEAATFIQSLILVFARLSLVSAQGIVNFLADIQINGQIGLQLVLAKWLENSINFSGYDEVRQNVIALSKLYALNDDRVRQTHVKGDLIMTNNDQIMTRSRARLNPDQYTIIPAPLKIVKVLVEELVSASGTRDAISLASGVAAAEDAEDADGDENWEDDIGAADKTSTLDLSLGSTKAELMGFGDGAAAGDRCLARRSRDNETEAYLQEFFRGAAQNNVAGFSDWFGMLTNDERMRLQSLLGAAPTA